MKRYTSDPLPWRTLACAIIAQAIDDLRRCKKACAMANSKNYRRKRKTEMRHAMAFLRSQWAKQLLSLPDSPMQYDAAMAEIEKIYTA